MQVYRSGRPKEVDTRNTEQRKSVPKKPGEYRIITDNKSVQYIGQTRNLNRRMNEHMHTGKINNKNCIFAYQQADGRASHKALIEHEKKKIKKHNPPLNQRAGGGGRPFKHLKSKES